MTAGVVSALLVLAACGLAVPAGSRARLARLGGARTPWWSRLVGRWRGLLAEAEVSGRLAVGCASCGAAVIATIGYGLVAGVIAAAYAGLAAHVVLRRRAAAVAGRALTDALDGVANLVADLRAGVAPAHALDAALPTLIGARRHGGVGMASVADLDGYLDDGPRGRVLSRLVAAWRLAETTGAPLGDVLERLEAEVRGGERTRALAAAHAASAQATATLLAALPLAGIALGYGLGADPLHLLLHSPIGGACAIAAVALQLAGLAWARRLARVDPDRVDLVPGDRRRHPAPWDSRRDAAPRELVVAGR
jgi:tight adherence protein B